MAEICLECWGKLSDEREPKWKYVLSKELDLCEECGEWRLVIVKERFILARQVLGVLGRVVLLPWLIWKKHKGEVK